MLASPPTRPLSIAPRYLLKIPAVISRSYKQGKATVWDMSLSGARLEDCDMCIDEGETVSISFSFYPDSSPVQSTGVAVGQTETGGVRIAFRDVKPRTRELLRRLLPKIGSERMLEEDPTITCSGRLSVDVGVQIQLRCGEAARLAGLELGEWVKSRLQEAASAELASEESQHPAD